MLNLYIVFESACTALFGWHALRCECRDGSGGILLHAQAYGCIGKFVLRMLKRNTAAWSVSESIEAVEMIVKLVRAMCPMSTKPAEDFEASGGYQLLLNLILVQQCPEAQVYIVSRQIFCDDLCQGSLLEVAGVALLQCGNEVLRSGGVDTWVVGHNSQGRLRRHNGSSNAFRCSKTWCLFLLRSDAMVIAFEIL